MSVIVIIPKVFSIDAIAGCSIVMNNVTTLNELIRDDFENFTVFVMKWLAPTAKPFLTCAKSPEVLGCHGMIISKETENHPLWLLSFNRNIKPDFIGDHF